MIELPFRLLFWWMRPLFWLLYHPLARSYDRISRWVSRGQWGEWQRTALAELDAAEHVTGPVLELAFGTGTILIELARQQRCPVGLDLSPDMVRLARFKLRCAALDVPLTLGRAQSLPFADASFAAVLATFPADFIWDERTWREAARVLRPGGRLVMVIGARLLGQDWISHGLELLYTLTGQRGQLPDLNEPLAQWGWTCQVRQRRVGDSEVLLVIAQLLGGDGVLDLGKGVGADSFDLHQVFDRSEQPVC